MNDKLEGLQGHLRINVYQLNGEKVFGYTQVEVEAQSSSKVGVLSEAAVLQGRRAEEVMIELVSEGFAAPHNRYFLRDPKDIALPSSLS